MKVAIMLVMVIQTLRAVARIQVSSPESHQPCPVVPGLSQSVLFTD